MNLTVDPVAFTIIVAGMVTLLVIVGAMAMYTLASKARTVIGIQKEEPVEEGWGALGQGRPEVKS